MTIFKTEKTKSYVENIKNEQCDKKLTNIEKLEEWEQRFADQIEERDRITNILWDKEKEINELGKCIVMLSKKNKEKIEELEKFECLEKGNESEQIVLLKEIHQRKIKKLNEIIVDLKNDFKIDKLLLSHEMDKGRKKEKEMNELKKGLEEKKILIENLMDKIEELEISRNANLSAVKLAEKWGKIRENKLEQKIGTLENAGNEILAKLVEKDKRNKSQKEYIENLEKKLYEQGELLKKELGKSKSQKVEIEILQGQMNLTNYLYLNKKPLPKTPNKFKIFKVKTKTGFQRLIEKTKHKIQELVSRIEIRTK